ncbi:BZ3500_MvSof-1268-A1-R1_Chr1-3g02043 [Microbotryum saponariae]|uniref:BZ3500_MvSof-1268-A1-R1_Chr1-3g02043 protein n=1 Tax=Microbotryum saponariae TaxID=289078 RepID=A0A2X0MGC1_9BASI|nr:BZ3500_MvSof-1268-A1-R1_Chr1-3g02043 [Microbotryum saponariae]SCZ95241.1 BZ3501_MvSof-1269-A2-R1_Chr1-3g01645 [Microbotryum saponariae]
MTYAKRVIEPRRVSVDGNGWQELAWRGDHESKVEVGQGGWRRCAAVQWMQGLLCLGSDTHDRIT